MNEQGINWTGVLAVIALLELFRNAAWAIIMSFVIKPARHAAKKLDNLQTEITSLNLTAIHKTVEDHEQRVRHLEGSYVGKDGLQHHIDEVNRDRRLMNKKLDILLQRTASQRNPVTERELTDDN
ncbi:MAG TPA: hypothetical protein VMV72_18515 [Verrucomicrobiae bacterium]|nr:hypothetical protein [Verrucomicrobiae bacterium]